MKPDEILKYAADNCPYKKFKWHTEDMCDNCREVAEEIRAIVEGRVQEARHEEMEKFKKEKRSVEANFEAKEKLAKEVSDGKHAEEMVALKESVCDSIDDASREEIDFLADSSGFFEIFTGKRHFASTRVTETVAAIKRRIMK